jgi:hypothetical protein
MSEEKHKAAARAWYHRNKEKARAAKKEWEQANPEKAASHARKSFRKSQGVANPTGETRTGVCDICGEIKKLYFDHDHQTRKHRGWLCNYCNLWLGWFEKAKVRGVLERTIEYLKSEGTC